MAAESKLEKECRKLAIEHGYELLKWVSPGVKGVPDRILLGPYESIVFIEFKTPGETPSIAQQRWLRRLQEFGFDAVVIWDLDRFKRLLLISK